MFTTALQHRKNSAFGHWSEAPEIPPAPGPLASGRMDLDDVGEAIRPGTHADQLSEEVPLCWSAVCYLHATVTY